jgi:hypothetical protein
VDDHNEQTQAADSQQEPTQDSGLQTPQPDQPIPTESTEAAETPQEPASEPDPGQTGQETPPPDSAPVESAPDAGQDAQPVEETVTVEDDVSVEPDGSVDETETLQSTQHYPSGAQQEQAAVDRQAEIAADNEARRQRLDGGSTSGDVPDDANDQDQA